MIVKIGQHFTQHKRFHLFIVSVSFPWRFQAVLGAVVVNFDFQNVNDGNWQQQEHKYGDPLEFLIEFDACLESTGRVHQLRELKNLRIVFTSHVRGLKWLWGFGVGAYRIRYVDPLTVAVDHSIGRVIIAIACNIGECGRRRFATAGGYAAF